jgi:glycosyltransferase involved in cell wall biosynthesis
MRRIEEWLVSRADRILVYSQFVRNHVHATLSVPLEKMRVIPLAAPSGWKEKFEQKLPKPSFAPDRYILYCGGYAARKNVPMLLKACAVIIQKQTDFKGVFVGLNDKKNDQRLVEVLNGIPDLRFLISTNRITDDELAALYQHCEFVVYPSLSEGFGLPILEAGVAKKLCLCGDNSSMREIQATPKYRIPSEKQDLWEEAIIKYWTDKNLLREANNICYEKAICYTWAEAAKVLVEIL